MTREQEKASEVCERNVRIAAERAHDLECYSTKRTEDSTDSASASDTSTGDGHHDPAGSRSLDPSPEPTTEQSPSQSTSTDEPDEHKYPYFVCRSKVLDERDERIEAHLRKEVLDQETDFRSNLADVLDTDNIPKSDAREFALKFAFENPEGVAELMRDEGFGEIG